MRFKHHPQHKAIPNTEAWQVRRGFWSFLIMHEKKPGARYYTSYRDQRAPVPANITNESATAIIFFGDQEFRNTTISAECGYRTIDDAMRACEKKYKELLTR